MSAPIGSSQTFLHPEEREKLRRIFSFPEETPAPFVSYIVEQVQLLALLSLSQIQGFSAEWKEWAPALTGSATNPTLGTGSDSDGRYNRRGNTVEGVARFQVGTSYTNGSGTLLISVPAAASASAVGHNFIVGNGWLLDSSTGTYTRVNVELYDATHLQVRAAALVTYTSPQTFADSDEISVHFSYEAA